MIERQCSAERLGPWPVNETTYCVLEWGHVGVHRNVDGLTYRKREAQDARLAGGLRRHDPDHPERRPEERLAMHLYSGHGCRCPAYADDLAAYGFAEEEFSE